MSQSTKAMVYSVLATLGLLVGFLALSPTADRDFDPGIDVEAARTEVANIASFVPVTVDAPDTWRANFARWNSGATDDVPAWNVGYLTDEEEFFGISQTANASNSWIRGKIDPATDSETITLAGHDVQRWLGRDEHIYLVAEFDHPADANPGRAADAIQPSDTMTLVISGSMDEDTLHDLAADTITQYR